MGHRRLNVEEKCDEENRLGGTILDNPQNTVASLGVDSSREKLG